MTAWIDSNDSRYEYTYDHRHRCITQSGAEWHLANRFTYGEARAETGDRTTTHINGEGATTVYQLNDLYQVTAETDPLGNTTPPSGTATTTSWPAPTPSATRSGTSTTWRTTPPPSSYRTAAGPRRRTTN